jgi:translation initiation factor IF-3
MAGLRDAWIFTPIKPVRIKPCLDSSDMGVPQSKMQQVIAGYRKRKRPRQFSGRVGARQAEGIFLARIKTDVWLDTSRRAGE